MRTWKVEILDGEKEENCPDYKPFLIDDVFEDP